MKMYNIPHMVVCREDIKSLGIKRKILDEEMEEIANGMSKALMNDWNICLRTVVGDVL